MRVQNEYEFVKGSLKLIKIRTLKGNQVANQD